MVTPFRTTPLASVSNGTPLPTLSTSTNHASITDDNIPTKKSIASVIARLYDPLGLISPFVLQARKFLRWACKQKLSWKKPLPPAMKQEWEQWLPLIQVLNFRQIPTARNNRSVHRISHFCRRFRVWLRRRRLRPQLFIPT